MASTSSSDSAYDSAGDVTPTPIPDTPTFPNHFSSLSFNDVAPPETSALSDRDLTEEVLEERENESANRPLDYPVSPTSSGYAAERGSSGPASTADEIEEDDDDDNGSSIVNGVADSQEAWIPGKRHEHEDDASMSWRKRKKHFFVLSHSGKPIYSRYGDEHKLAGFSATLQAIISFVENGGDRVKLVRAGKHQVVFLVKGPIYLVCISCTEEPYDSLRGQLELLYGQVLYCKMLPIPGYYLQY